MQTSAECTKNNNNNNNENRANPLVLSLHTYRVCLFAPILGIQRSLVNTNHISNSHLNDIIPVNRVEPLGSLFVDSSLFLSLSFPLSLNPFLRYRVLVFLAPVGWQWKNTAQLVNARQRKQNHSIYNI